jgi:hypothetical protein
MTTVSRVAVQLTRSRNNGQFVNQGLAQHALSLLTRLFWYGRIEHHGAFLNLAENRVQPIPINPAVWRRIGRRGRRVVNAARAA